MNHRKLVFTQCCLNPTLQLARKLIRNRGAPHRQLRQGLHEKNGTVASKGHEIPIRHAVGVHRAKNKKHDADKRTGDDPKEGEESAGEKNKKEEDKKKEEEVKFRIPYLTSQVIKPGNLHCRSKSVGTVRSFEGRLR